MKIINRENVFTNKQIESIIKLLGKDYKPSKIVVYETRFDMLRYYSACFNFTLEEFRGELEGSYDQSSDTAYICIFAQTDDGDDLHSKQLYSLHALVHELRHRYQYVNNYLINNDEKAEKDADAFATRFVNGKSRKISKIMGWKDEWTVEEED
jgi:Zn-dependent peptidase ImmA (M78 family)